MSRWRWITELVDLALPAGCVVCRSWLPEASELVCPLCRSRLKAASWPRCPRCHHPRGTGRAAMADCLHCREWPAAVKRARAAYLLGGPAADLVHALKYEGWCELADFMAGRMVMALDPVPDPAAVVVPIPTTARRLRARGYNQAGVLARRIAELLGLARSDALARASGRRSQTALAPSERRRNVRGAFVPTEDAQRVVGRDVVLVDDVLTTGATAGEAASVLSARGAATVTVLAFARAVPDAVTRAA